MESEEWVISFQVSNQGAVKKVFSSDVFESAEEASMWIPDYMSSPELFSLTDEEEGEYILEAEDELEDAEVVLVEEDD